MSGCHDDATQRPPTPCSARRARARALDVVDYRDMKDFAPVPEYASFATVTRAASTRRAACAAATCSRPTSSPTPATCPRSATTPAPTPYEQIRFLESAYENRYILDAFRRGRTQFNSDGVVDARSRATISTPSSSSAKTFGFAMVLEVDDPAKPDPALLVDGNYGPLAMGTSVAFDLFARMLTRPEPGAYCSTGNDKCPARSSRTALTTTSTSPIPIRFRVTPYDFQVPLGKGRYIHNDFDYGQGYWWSDYQKQVGSFYDKTWAIYYLSESFDTFISNSKEDFIDGRYKNINFATVYPEQVRRLFAGLLTGDIESYRAVGGLGHRRHRHPERGARVSRLARRGRARHAAGRREARRSRVRLQRAALRDGLGNDVLPDRLQSHASSTTRASLRSPTEQPSWPAAETYTFIDPATSITYRARTTGTESLFGVDRQKSIGARMLEWANNLEFDAYICETDAQGYYLLNADGTPKLVLDKNGKPQVNPDNVGGDANLKRYVANIETMRQLVGTFVVPLEDSLPQP